MDLFPDGQQVRLRNRVRGTFLRADEDGLGVSLSPRGASPDDAAWEVRLVLRDGSTYVLLRVHGSHRFLAVSPGRRGERRVVQAERRYDGEVLWRATWVGRSRRQRRYVLLRHAFLGLCLRADGRVAGVSVDHVRNECAMMHWVVEADASAMKPAPPPPSSVPVWAPVVRASEADGGLSSSWLPLMDSRGGLVAHLQGNLVGGAAQLLRDGRGELQVHAHAAASLVRAAWDRVGRDLRAGGLLAVLPEDVARLAAARRFLAVGGAFRAAQRALWPRAAVLLPLRLVGDGNAPAALRQDQEAADAAAARARTPEEDAGRDADPAAVHPRPGAPGAPAPAITARGPQQQQIAARPGRRTTRKAKNALLAYKPELEEPAGDGHDEDDDEDDEDLPPSSVKLLLSHLSSLEHGMLRRQGNVRDGLQELGELEIRAQRGTGSSEDEVPVKEDIRKLEESILATVDSYNVMVPMADEVRQDIADKGATPPRPHPALAQSPEELLTPSLRLRLQRRREKQGKRDSHS